MRVESEAIRRCIKLTPRQGVHLPSIRKDIRKDVRRIFALGRFQDVQVEVEKHPKGAILIYRVKERPMLRKIRIVGHKHISRDDIKKVMDVKPFAILDKVKIRDNVHKILAYYHSQGYHFARVESKISKPLRAAVDVTFKIRENAKIRIRKIYFVGNRQVKSSTLKSIVYSQEFNLLSWITGRSVYQRALTARDVHLLRAYYLDKGHLQVVISTPKVQLAHDRKSIGMTFHIKEGPRYRYGKIDVKGDRLWSRRHLLQQISMRKGQFFHRTKLFKQNLLRLQTMYQNRGYAHVNIIPQHHLDEERRRVDITFLIRKGKQTTIERIEIIGNATTRDSVIRRQIRIKEGDLYHGSKIEESQRRIFALGYFAKTHPRYGVKVVSRTGSAPGRMRLQFVVKEKPSGSFRFGFGYGGTNGFMVTASISKKNFMGWGKSVSLNLQLGFTAQQIQAQFVDPNFLGTDLTVGVSFYHLMSQANDFQQLGFGEMRTGGSLTLAYPIFDRFRALLTYRAERVGRNPLTGNITESTLLARTLFGRDGATLTSSLSFGLQLDLRNNRLFPTNGTFHSASVEVADSFLGSQNQFYRFTLINRGYVELPLGLVFKVNTELGLVLSADDRAVPYLTRYRLGGARTIRGYGELSIGPQKTIATGIVDTTTLNWGGNKQVLLNVELEIPIISKLGIKAVAFFDAGNVFADNEFFFQDLRNPGLPMGLLMSAGFGLRWQSPMGLLRFEFGFPLARRPHDDTWRFHFQIGNSF